MATGWYVPAVVELTTADQRIVEAAVQLPAYGAVTGWAAMHWMGARWFEGLANDACTRLPVTLAIGDGNLRPGAAVAISKERLLPTDIEVVDGLRVTSAVRSVLFEMRYAATLGQAVSHLDMAAYADLVSLEEAAAYAAELSSCTGIPRARSAVSQGDENAWSPTEVSMRLMWSEVAGLPRPLCNRPIFSLDGRHLLTPDLFDPDAGVAGEYEGIVHLDRTVRKRDVERDEIYRSLSIERVIMTAPDLGASTFFAARAQAAYARGLGQRGRHRNWTIEPPGWWRETLTVEQRRALSEADRRRLLGSRRAA